MFQGRNFGHGFASAGVTQAFAGSIDGIDEGQRFSPKRIVAAAVIGGTSSSITGGKFSNGAVTGAFSRAFNDELHDAHVKKYAAQKRRDEIRSELYDQLEGLSSYGDRESGFILYEGENGEILVSDLITGKRNMLFDEVRLGVKDGNGYISKGQFGVDRTSKIIEVLHTHPDHSTASFSGGKFGDVWFSEKFNFDISLSYKGQRRIYQPTGNVNLSRPRKIKSYNGERL